MQGFDVHVGMKHTIDITDGGQTPFKGQGADAFCKDRTTNNIDHEVHTFAAGRCHHFFVKMGLSRANAQIQARRLDLIELGLGAGGSNDVGAQGFAHGQRRDPHPRTHPGDEHPLTSLQAALYHQHFKHHDGGEWNGRGLIPIQIVGHLHGLAWGHEDIFCKGAWGPSHHPVTRRKTRDPKPATHHFAGRFHANGLGCSRLVQSMPQDKFTAVEP